MIQVGPGQKVRTDHFQPIASRSVASKYQSCGLDCPLNDGNLEDSDFLCWSGRLAGLYCERSSRSPNNAAKSFLAE
jgi:hypothetical protein